jgi:hypothetical protein
MYCSVQYLAALTRTYVKHMYICTSAAVLHRQMQRPRRRMDADGVVNFLNVRYNLKRSGAHIPAFTMTT